VAPVVFGEEAGDAVEHIAYGILKKRHGIGDVVKPDGQYLLVLNGETGEFLPLDTEGAMLVEGPRGDTAFKRLSLGNFLDYERCEQELVRLLGDAESRGYFAFLEPEAYPTFLAEYARTLREDLLKNPGEEQKAQWLDFRFRYFRSLDDFVYGPSEANLVTGYELLIAAESLDAPGVDRIVSLRGEVIGAFERIRKQHQEFLALRTLLSEALEDAICFLGPPASPQDHAPADTEAAAILANGIITGRAVIPLTDRYVLLWSLAAIIITVFAICRFGPGFTLIIGSILTALIAALFSWLFIVTDYWLDPLIPAASALMGVFASFCYAVSLSRRTARDFRRAYGPYIGKSYLKRVIRAGRPLPSETVRAKAAIVAIRGGELLSRENQQDPRESLRAIEAFRAEVVRTFSKAGGAIVGLDGDLVLVAIGSPLERIGMNKMKSEMPYEDAAGARGSHSPAVKAVGFILEFLAAAPAAGSPGSASWRFGIDAGECAFTYSALSGYSAFGPPTVRARILSGLAPRYNARILVTGAVSEKVDGMLTRRLDVLKGHGGSQEVFYQLLTRS
jgi:class 3 adenylate cyclase